MQPTSLACLLAVISFFVTLGGCNQNAKPVSQNTATNHGDGGSIAFDLPLTRNAKDSITVQAATFKNNDPIPLAQTAYDKSISPALNWSGAPKNTKTFALMLEDPDSVSPQPFIHWLVANIPASRNNLPANLPAGALLKSVGGAQQGAGSGGNIGYFGPQPPAGSGVHHYHFQIFALDEKLNLPSGFDRQALLGAMKNHVLAKGQIIGTFERRPS
jgi:Raf kinase inhibitor-like YbhB/YbcL family protein